MRKDRRTSPVQRKVEATLKAAAIRNGRTYEKPLKITGSVDDVLRAAVRDDKKGET